MSVKKISELDAASTLNDGCCFPLVQSDTTKKVTFQTMRQAVADSDEMAAKLALKQNAESGKGLSTNDYTTAEKNKLATVDTNANENVIEGIKVNGVRQTVTDKIVNIVDKEWTLKGTISGDADDRGNIDTGVDVDMTDCTEMYIFAKVTSTNSGYLNAETSGGAISLSNSLNKNGGRTFVGIWETDFMGIHPIDARYQDSVSSSVGAIRTAATANVWVDGTHIADITKLTFSNTAVVTSCDLKIYAR